MRRDGGGRGTHEIVDLLDVGGLLVFFEPWPAAHPHVEWGSQATRLAADRGDAVVVVDTPTVSMTERERARVGMQCRARRPRRKPHCGVGPGSGV